MAKVVVTRNQRHRIVAASFVLLLLGVVALNVFGSGSVTASAENTSLTDTRFALFEGNDATLADFDGRPLVVNFWASWCPACVAELPEFQSVHEQYRDDVTILGIANTDQRNAALALAGDVGLTYQLADDPQGDLFRELELFAMPSTLFITADGQVQEVFAGQLNEAALSERIDSLIEAS